MIGAKFYKLYNRLLADAATPEEIIRGIVNHAQDVIPSLALCFGGIIDKGCYRITASSSRQFMPQNDLYLSVNDVHRSLFSLETSYICTSKFLEGIPYLTEDSYNSITDSLSEYLEGPGQALNLMFFCDDFLYGYVILIAEAHQTFTEKQLEELYFIRNSIEALFYKLYSRKEANLNSQFQTVGETIIRSSQLKMASSKIFISRLLNLAFELSGEADYGSCLLLENHHWHFIHAIGHHEEQLLQIKLPGDTYFNRSFDWKGRKEVSPNVYIFPSIIDRDASPMYEANKEVFQKIKEASLPILETIQLHIHFDGVLKGIVSLDIGTDSKGSFTQKTIRVLKRIEFLGQILFTLDTIHAKNQSFENLTSLISKLVDPEAGTDSDFLNDYLQLMVDSLYEADYASAYIRDRESIRFLASVGHDLEGLKAVDLKPEHFVSVEDIHKSQLPFKDQDGEAKRVSATLFSDLLNYAQTAMPPDVFDAYMKATRPIKDGIISQAKLSGDTYMYISCDIRKESPLTFSQDSMHLFSILNNLGFSFMANQYYMDEYRSLNRDLEVRIAKRTKELEASNRKLQDIAIRDSMTGLLNHKTIIERLEDIVAKEAPISIFLFDIDHFKNVNDTYGHQIGDEVLIRISALMQSEDALSGRYGGEEFMLLMPEITHAQALEHCQRLAEAIKDARLIDSHPITVSGGVVTRRTGTASELIQSADTLLYKAKNSGRDRILDGFM